MHALLLTREHDCNVAMLKALESQQIKVVLAPDLLDMVDIAYGREFDCIILDSLLPAKACEAVKRIREARVTSPIIVVDSSKSSDDRIRLYECGADECVLRPFSMSEFVARLRALVRRQYRIPDHTLRVADLEVDSARRTARRNGKPLNLTGKEFALLEYMMRNAGRPLTRSMIMEHVWHEDYEGLTNVVDVFINMLRRKVDKNFEPKLLRTARGIGYMIEDLSDVGISPDARSMDEARTC
jgi:two-component system copper resistance phosphate regulon response regulator CusR